MHYNDNLRQLLLPLMLAAVLFASAAPIGGKPALNGAPRISMDDAALAQWRQAYEEARPMIGLGN